MENVGSLIKRFHKLDHLQEEKVLQYILFDDMESGNHKYGIQINMECNGVVETDIDRDISDSRENAENILSFLYENSVLISNWRDITSDLVSQIG